MARTLTPVESARLDYLLSLDEKKMTAAEQNELFALHENVDTWQPGPASLAGPPPPPPPDSPGAALAGNGETPGGAGVGDAVRSAGAFEDATTTTSSPLREAADALTGIGDTQVSSRMMNPNFSGGAGPSGNMLSNWWGGLEGKTKAGLVMTGIGAAMYMMTREKPKDNDRIAAVSASQTGPGPSTAQSNPYAATMAGSPAVRSFAPGGFQIF